MLNHAEPAKKGEEARTYRRRPHYAGPRPNPLTSSDKTKTTTNETKRRTGVGQRGKKEGKKESGSRPCAPRKNHFGVHNGSFDAPLRCAAWADSHSGKTQRRRAGYKPKKTKRKGLDRTGLALCIDRGRKEKRYKKETESMDAMRLGDLPDELLAAIVEDNHGGRICSASRPLDDRDVFALAASDRRLAAAASRVYCAARERAALTRRRTLLLRALCAAAAADGRVNYVYVGEALHGGVPTYVGLHLTLHHHGSPPSVYWTLRGDPLGDTPSMPTDVIGASGLWPRLDDRDFVDRLFDTWLASTPGPPRSAKTHVIVRPTGSDITTEPHARLCALLGGDTWKPGPIGLAGAPLEDVWARWCAAIGEDGDNGDASLAVHR